MTLDALPRMSSPSLHRCLTISFALLVTFVGSLCGQSAALATEELTPDKAAKLAGLYFKLNQNAECRASLEKLLHQSPKHIEGLLLLGRLELREGHATPAIKASSRALDASPDNLDAMVLKAYALRAGGQVAESDALLKRIPPDELDARRDDYQAAVSATVETPDTPGAPVTRDIADILDEKLDQARAALDKNQLSTADKLSADALKSAPTDLQAVTVRAEVLSRSGKPADAAKLLAKTKAAQPPGQHTFPPELDLASALRDSGQTEAARKSFQSIADNTHFPAEDRSQAVEALKELKKCDLVAAGEKALDRGDFVEAALHAEAALKLNPQCPDAQALHARVLHGTGHSAEAAQKLAALKAATPAGEIFGEQMAYADALRGSNDFRAAEAAYNEIIAKEEAYSADDRLDARDQLKDLQENHLAGGSAELLTGKFEEGKLWRATSQFASTRFAQTRYLTTFRWDNVQLSNRLYPSSLSKDVFSATVGMNRLLTERWSGNLFLGAHETNAMAHGGLSYTSAKGTNLGIDLAWHDPARDTLLLTAMDGRQNAITATAEVPLSQHFAWDSTFLARQIEADGTRIGESVGIESQLRWHPFKIDQDIYIAYALELKDFSPDNAAFDRQARRLFGHSSGYLPSAIDAVPDRINRHALQVHASIPLWPKLLASATTEVAWRQEAQEFEVGAVAELLWKINDRTSVNARLEYYSGGSGPNSGEDVILGAVGSRWTW